MSPETNQNPKIQDQAENVPTPMLGEANYRKFVASYKPDGLIVGGASGVVGRWTGVARFGCVL